MGAETNLAARCDASTRDIEATRHRIHEKADFLEERLKPGALLRPLKRRVEETLGAGGGKILDAFRDHPLPLALTGLGLGWLMLRDFMGVKGRGVARGPGESGRAAEAVGKVKEGASHAMEKTRDVLHKAGDAAAAMPGKVRQGARAASDWFSGAVEESPMLLALGALAAGLAAGLSVPVSAKEEEAVESLVEKAEEAVLERTAAEGAPDDMDEPEPPPAT